MIVAVGLDLVDVERITAAMQNPKFLSRILTPAERCEVGDDPMRVAGRWAAKEAAYKALGIPSLKWQDVEIQGGGKQAPKIVVSHPEFNSQSLRIHLSLSHERGHAAAVVILEAL